MVTRARDAGVDGDAMTPAILVVAFLVSAALTHCLCAVGHRVSQVDVPNERSLHDTPTPRSGGLAIVVCTAVFGLATAWSLGARMPWLAIGAAGLVAVVSYLDDHVGVSPLVRLAVHFAAAALVGAGMKPGIAALGPLASLPEGAQVVAIVVFLSWFTNLYNFMDGMDGFAGGMTVIGFGVYAVLAFVAGAPVFAALCAVIAASAAGFLLYNFPPARIFMGDVGSSTLGFLAGTFALVGIRDGVLQAPAALLVFAPFSVDATATLLKRAITGERVWRPHRTHYYQRLVRLGWGHRRTVLSEYAVMIACAATAVAGSRIGASAWKVLVPSWAAVFVGLMWIVHRLERLRVTAPQTSSRNV